MSNSFYPADILLPKKTTNMSKWSVVACDQFTSEPEYWDSVKEEVSACPSALNLIFPEAYLADGDKRISEINLAMKKYLNDGLFDEYKNSFIFVKRTLKNGKTRTGIIGAIDLEDYNYEKGSKSNIRATEGTVLERIPPRVKIREDAPLELPHIMVLIDDPTNSVMNIFDACSGSLEKLYDFELMKEGGHIKGYLADERCKALITEKLNALASPAAFNERYKIENAPLLTFAVGDGNHSLATAKACWENIKKTLSEQEQKTHPARFALCEIVNLHDTSLEFEPIHRVMFNIDPEDVLSELSKFYPAAAPNKSFTCIYNGLEKNISVFDDKNNLAVGTLQVFIDDYLKKHSDAYVDYIHGDDVVKKLCKKSGTIGFLLPPMQKSELFRTVILDGALPRKTFSMGEACDKRYYLEAKRIK